MKKNRRADEIGYTTEFGFACKLLLDKIAMESVPMIALAEVFNDHFRIAELAAKNYPDLKVDLDDLGTYPFATGLPIVSVLQVHEVLPLVPMV